MSGKATTTERPAQEWLELTTHDRGEAEETAAPRSDLAHLRALIEEIATLPRELRTATDAATGEALDRIVGRLTASSAEIEARLMAAAAQAESVAPMTRELLDNSAELVDWAGSRYAEMQRDVAASLDALAERMERRLETLAATADAPTRRISEAARQLETESRRLGWRPWATGAAAAAGTILVLTLLRPGWTMSQDQRTALRVGESVLHAYTLAPERDRAEMRRVMGWRGAPERSAAPPHRAPPP